MPALPVLLAVFAVSATDAGPLQVLVLDIEVAPDVDPSDARTLTDLVPVEAAARPAFKVITGADLARLAELEGDRAALGCEESASCLAEIAGALGARFVISGRLSVLDRELLLQISLFDAAAAAAIARRAVRAPDITGLVDQLREAVLGLLDEAADKVNAEGGSIAIPSTSPGTNVGPPIHVYAGAGVLAAAAGAFVLSAGLAAAFATFYLLPGFPLYLRQAGVWVPYVGLAAAAGSAVAAAGGGGWLAYGLIASE